MSARIDTISGRLLLLTYPIYLPSETYIDLLGKLKQLFLISPYHCDVGAFHEDLLNESLAQPRPASCDKHMLIGESYRVAKGTDPSDCGLGHRKQDAEDK